MEGENINQVGHQQLTVSTAAVALTAPTGTNPRRALIYVGGQPIRWRADGTDPTAAIGMHVPAGGYIDWTERLSMSLIDRVKFIRDTLAGGDATLDIAYFD